MLGSQRSQNQYLHSHSTWYRKNRLRSVRIGQPAYTLCAANVYLSFCERASGQYVYLLALDALQPRSEEVGNAPGFS